MKRLRALVVKDLKVFRSDRRAVIVSFLVPALLATFMGFIAKGGGGRAKGPPHIDSLVVDEDDSPTSRALVAALAADPALAAKPATREAARAQLQEGNIAIAVVIPARFGAEATAVLRNGAPPTLPILYDPSHQMEMAIATGILGQHVRAAFLAQAGDEGRALAERCAGLAEPFKTELLPEVATGEKWNGAAHALVGMGVQFILFGAVEAAVAILTDRQRGLWKRLQAAPLSRATLLGSKIISGAITGAAVFLFLFLVGKLTLNVQIQGSLPGLALVAASYAIMASTLGVLISTLGKTPAVTRSLSIVAVLFAVMLSGAWFPSFLFPPWLQSAAKAFPTRWAVDGLDAMTWRGLGFDAALLPSAVLLGASALFCALAVLRFRWEE